MKHANCKISIVATLLLSSIQAHAGFGAHGGNVVQCQGREPVVLDYYHASLPTLGQPAPELVDFSGLSEEQTTKNVVKMIRDLYFDSFANQLEENIEKIGPMKNWIQADLKQVDDANEPYMLSASCVRKTAAVRQENVVMYGDATVINALSPAQRGLLEVHEALYLLSGKDSSETVRSLLRELLPKTTNHKKLKAAISNLGGDSTISARLCGLEQKTVASKIKNCSPQPNSSIITTSGGHWNLVTRFKRSESSTDYGEVWQDGQTGLVWGNALDGTFNFYTSANRESDGMLINESACASEEANLADGKVTDKDFGLPTQEEVRVAIAHGMGEITFITITTDSSFWYADSKVWYSNGGLITGLDYPPRSPGYITDTFGYRSTELVNSNHNVLCVGR